MKLVTKADLLKLRKQDPHDSIGPGKELPDTEAMVVTKFFTPDAQWTWYAVSASPDEMTGDIQFFGLVEGQYTEWGYFWLSELKKVRGHLGLPIERDKWWKPITVTELKSQVGVGI